MVDLADLFKEKPQAIVDTNIGVLCLFSISIGGQSELLKTLDAGIEKTDPREFLKKLIIYICYPKDRLKDGEYKPDKPILGYEQVDKLSDEDLENIAKAYVSSNEYLFKKSEFEKRKDTEGKEVHYSVYTEIDHPQKSEESFINYLHRLSCLEQDKQKERMSSILGAMPKLDSFSKALSSGIAKNLLLGDSLANSLKSIRTKPDFEFTTVSPPEPIDWDKIERQKEKVRREPFDDLAQRLDELINSSVQASEFMVETNRIQTEIATEIKAGGNTTDRHSRNNIKLTLVVIFLTVTGLLVSGWSVIAGISFSEEAEKKIATYSNKLTDSIAANNKELRNDRMESRSEQVEMLTELKKLNESFKNNQNHMSYIYREMEALEASNQEYEKQIKELNDQLQAIKRSEN